MTRAGLDRLCERAILLLVGTILIFGPLATGAVRPGDFLVLQGLMALALVFWAGRLWLRPRYRMLMPPVAWGVLAGLFYAALICSRAELAYVARQEWCRLLVYGGLFFIILNNLYPQKTIRLLVCLLVIVAMAIAAYGLFQFFTRSEHVWGFIKPPVFVGRASGTFINPNHLAGFLGMLLPLGLALGLAGRVGFATRIVLVYASLVLLAGIATSFSRGGWLATGLSLAMLVLWLVRGRAYRLPVLLLAVFLVAGAGLFLTKVEFARERLERPLAIDNPQSALARVWLWQAALAMWRDHPWFGVGPGHFDFRFPAYRPPEIQARPQYVHNDYLNTLADWGIVGSALLAFNVLLLAAGLRTTWRCVAREQASAEGKQSNRVAVLLGASAGLLAIALHSVTDFNLQLPANALLAVTLVAVIATHSRFATERFWVGSRWPSRLLATTLILGAAIYLAVAGVHGYRELRALNAARPLRHDAIQRVAALEQAHALEPRNFQTTYDLGESLRQISWATTTNPNDWAEQAIGWFQITTRLNPRDAYAWFRWGMCLHWIGRSEEAGHYFDRALELDPNNYYVVAHYGWHKFQLGDYVEAKRRFEQSIELQHAWKNPIARAYLEVVNRQIRQSPPSLRNP